MADWVELRVHGVHDTSPGAMLGVRDDGVGQIAGDNLTGVYRVVGQPVPLRTLEIPVGVDGLPGRIAVEAYSWGALTSGAQGALGWVRRVGWMLLLPFALTNLAYWARLHVAVGDGRDRWGTRAVRASGVLLTVFLVLAPCVIAIDMLGWQCFREDASHCSRLPGAFDFLSTLTAGQRLVLTSLAPVLTIALLWWLSRQSATAYEVKPVAAAKGERSELILRRTAMWASSERTAALRIIHVAASLAAVVLFVSTHVARVDAERGLTVLSIVLVVLAGLVLVGCLLLVSLAQQGDMEADGEAVGPKPKQGQALCLLAAVLLVVQSVTLLAYTGTMNETLAFQGDDWWFLGLFVLLTTLHLSVFFGARLPAWIAVPLVLGVAVGGFLIVVGSAIGWIGEWSTTEYVWALVGAGLAWGAMVFWHYRMAKLTPVAGMAQGEAALNQVAWRGAGASVLLASAAWIALLFTSSAVIAAANYLNGSQTVADLVAQQPPSSATPVDEYSATGPTTIQNALIIQQGDTLTVRGGTVTADRFTARTGGSIVNPRASTTRVTQNSSVSVDVTAIELDASCLVQVDLGATSCRDAGATPLVQTLTVSAGQTIRIEPAGKHRPVTIRPREGVQSALVIPQVLAWTPMGQLAWLLLVGLVLLWCVAHYNGTGAHDIKEVLDERKPPDDEVPLRDREGAWRKRKAAGLAHRAETLLDAAGSVTGLVAILLIVSSLTGEAPWDRPGMPWARGLATISFYAMLGVASGMVLIGSYLRRSESARKAVGIIWDLTTFWPRAAHPLAPPCYAERVVPELETRARWVLGSSPDSRLVLSGHSQGSLIVAAMASRLDDEDFARTRLITYGSQIRALYGRIFPRVFGAEAIGYQPTPGRSTLVRGFPDSGFGQAEAPAPAAGSLRERIETNGGSWVNLFRRSDPLGFRVFSDDDATLPDVPVPPRSGSDVPVIEVPLESRGDPGPQVRTHGGYQQSQTYRDVVCRWAHEVPFEDTYDADGVIGLPPMPTT